MIQSASRSDGAVGNARRATAEWIRTHLVLFVGIVGCLVLLAVLRGPWIINGTPVGLDESQLLAAGRQARIDMIPYHQYTTYTFLFLWPMFLGALRFLDFPLGYPSAHALEALFDVFMVMTGWYLLAKESDWRLATAAFIAPTVSLFLVVGPADDFTALDTEALPLALILLAVWIVFLPGRALSNRRLLAADFVAGASILAKPQVGLLALAFVIGCELVRALESHHPGERGLVELAPLARRAALALAMFAVPSVLAALFLVATGEVHNFVSLGLGGTSGVFSYISLENHQTVSTIPRIFSAVDDLRPYAVVLLWAAGGLMGWTSLRARGWPGASALRTCVWLLPLVASFATFLVLGQFFEHYANIFYASCVIAAVFGARLTRLNPTSPVVVSSRAHRERSLYIVLCLVALAGVLVSDSRAPLLTMQSSVASNVRFLGTEVKSVAAHGRIAGVNDFVYTRNALTRACPAGSSAFVFGWSDNFYVDYDWRPVGLFLAETWEVPVVGAAAATARIILANLRADPPTCILSAIGPHFLGNLPAANTIQRLIPGATTLLAACYRRVEVFIGPAGETVSGSTAASWTDLWIRTASCA